MMITFGADGRQIPKEDFTAAVDIDAAISIWNHLYYEIRSKEDHGTEVKWSERNNLLKLGAAITRALKEKNYL